MFSYAGIGSRDITSSEESRISKISSYLHSIGYILYSGNAEGSDFAFQKSCQLGVSFLPWPGFNKHLASPVIHCSDISKDAYDSVDKFHPNPFSLSSGARKMMARNYQQVFGIGNLPRVSFVVFCANEKNGIVSGGTGQAVRIARSVGIECVNVRGNDWRTFLEKVERKEMVTKEEILERIWK